ncbi:SDR family oxidoreductase [bacterium]|nr:SDR family oxidoreductase [bacterium]
MIDTCDFVVTVTEEDVQAFAELSGDRNPLHVDVGYAQETEFRGPIAHGALLLSFASRVVGMYIPGRDCLILSMKARFPQPARYPTQLKVTGSLDHWNEETALGRVHVIAEISGTSNVVLDAFVDFTLHATRERETEATTESRAHVGTDVGRKPLVLITGGTGGLGIPVIKYLNSRYRLECLTSRDLGSSSSEEIKYSTVDLESPHGLENFLASVDPSEFYGIINMSSAPLSHAFASDDLGSIRKQLRHAVEVPLIFTKWARSPGSSVKRIVLIGSQSGTRLPQAKMGVYSIAKAAMEHLPVVLAADLSGIKATINVIALGATESGMNAKLSARALAGLSSKSGSGRVSSALDLSRLVEFLLSPESAQLNGTVIPLDGGVMQ